MKKINFAKLLLITTSLFAVSCTQNQPSSQLSESITPIGINITGEVTTIKEGETLQLTAVVYPEGASQDVNWTSSDETIATVNETGLVTALKKGNVNIIATSKANGSVTQQYSLIIEESEEVIIAPTSITLSTENNVTTIKTGETLNINVAVLPENASADVTWSVDNESLASIRRGELLALSVGEVTVTATSKIDVNVKGTLKITIKKSEEPSQTIDWSKQDFTTHANYVTCEDDTPLKVKGVVTAVSPLYTKDDKQVVDYYIQNGNDGYYIYAQSYTDFPVEEGKVYEVGGFKKYYRGLNEIVNVEYFKSSTENITYTVTDISSLDITSVDAMSVHHCSYVEADAIISSIPSIESKAYSVDVKIGENEIALRIDPKLVSSEDFAALKTAFATAVVGGEIHFKGMMSAFGYGKPSTQISIVKASDIEFGTLSNDQILSAAKDSLVLSATIAVSQTSISLPTTVEGFDGLTISWESNNESVISSTGAVTHSEEDVNVTLTATLSYNGTTATKTFNILVYGTNTNYTSVASLNFDDASLENNWGASKTKPDYNPASVELGTPASTWYIQNALIGGSSGDVYNGVYSLRSKSGTSRADTGRVELREDYDFNVVDFTAAVYGGDDIGIQIGVEYSTDSGTTWIDSNTTFTINTRTLDQYRVILPSGSKRVAIYVVENTGNRVNIDDINLQK